MALDTPVAFIIFNRPDLTQQVFQEIRKVQPKKLLVIADGSRFPEEQEKCAETRAIIDGVDWDCEVLKNYSDTNLTSPIRCSTGLDWVFSEVQEAIILEDDCIPSQSFFSFCQRLLDKYRDDERVMHISGSNFSHGPLPIDTSYCFSKYGTAWGWATWRRAWKHFDFEMKDWLLLREGKWIKSLHPTTSEQEYWMRIFDSCTLSNDPHWDYAWMFSCWERSGLSIIPKYNFVSNLGCREDGTRHNSPNDTLAEITSYNPSEFHCPNEVEQNSKTNQFLYETRFNRSSLPQQKPLNQKISRAIVSSLPIAFRDTYRVIWNLSKHNIKFVYGKSRRFIFQPKSHIASDGKLNLHLGCGYVNHPEFTNIDLLPARHIHYLRPINNLQPFKNESVDLIYASHCLEHFPYADVPEVIQEWNRVLKKKGILRISVPDLDKIIELYSASNKDVDKVQGILMGGQNYKLNYHMAIFNKQKLGSLLEASGFEDIREWYPGSSPMTNINDSSKFTVYQNGKNHPISLNLEANKK